VPMLESKPLKIVLLSRLKVHGEVFYEKLSKRHKVFWVGWRFPYSLNFFNAPFLMLYEFFYLAHFHETKSRGQTSIIFVHFISFDALVAVLFKKVCGHKVILYAIGSDVLGIRNAVQQRFLKWLLPKVDQVLCINGDIENQIRRIRNNGVVTIPPPFLEPRMEVYNGEKEYDAISMGQLTTLKMHSMLIHSCQYMKYGKTLAIVGDGPCKDYLTSLAKECQNHKILLLGNIPHEKVWVELQKARIYVHTSLREGIPASILEAIWCELPIIAVKASYTEDLTNLYGFKVVIVEERSPRSLAVAIEEVLRNYEVYRQMAKLNKKLLRDIIKEWDYKIERILYRTYFN